MTPEGYVVVIGAVFFGLQQTLKMYLDYRAAQSAQSAAQNAARATVEVKNELVKFNGTHAVVLQRLVDDVTRTTGAAKQAVDEQRTHS